MMRIETLVLAILVSGLGVAATPREEAEPFTPEQAQEHAKVFCSRAGLVDVALPDGQTRRLCGTSRDEAVITYDDVLDLLSRMNTEASREAWVYFPSVGDSIVVFNLERSPEGFYQRPKVVLAVPRSAFPPEPTAPTVRAWLAEQPAVATSALSPTGGAVIAWHQVE